MYPSTLSYVYVLRYQIVLNNSNKNRAYFTYILLVARCTGYYIFTSCVAIKLMKGKENHSSAKRQSSPFSFLFFCSCDNFYHKQEVRMFLYLLGQIVT